MSRVMHFEIHASDPQRLADFYSGLLGWTFAQWGPEDYWMITTGPDSAPGIGGGMLRRRGPAPADMQPVNSFVCTAGVESLDAVLGKLASLGGTIAVPKMPVKGIGWLAYIKDPDGNILGLMQMDPAAA